MQLHAAVAVVVVVVKVVVVADDDDDDIAACEVAVAGVGITGFSFEALRDDVKASVCSRRMPSDMYHINSHILSLIYTQQRQPTFRHVLLFPNVLQAVV